MFFVVNKEKLYAYIVSVFTVVMLLVMASVLMPNNNTVETSANIQRNVIMKETNNENINIVNN